MIYAGSVLPLPESVYTYQNALTPSKAMSSQIILSMWGAVSSSITMLSVSQRLSSLNIIMQFNKTGVMTHEGVIHNVFTSVKNALIVGALFAVITIGCSDEDSGPTSPFSPSPTTSSASSEGDDSESTSALSPSSTGGDDSSDHDDDHDDDQYDKLNVDNRSDRVCQGGLRR